MRELIALCALAFPGPVLAHAAATPGHWWTLDPWVWLPMAAMSACYLRGIIILRRKTRKISAAHMMASASFLAGLTALALALLWPLDAMSNVSFAAHMAQHMMLIVVAAPLMVLGRPGIPLLIGLPRLCREWATRQRLLRKFYAMLLQPGRAFALHGIMIWVWHAPYLYDWALQSRTMHSIEHVAFLGSAFLFWQAMLRSDTPARTRAGYGMASLYTLATLMHTGMLGALLTFAPRLLYPIRHHASDALLPPMDDQQLAGLLMWVPGGLCYLVAGLAFAYAWLASAGSPTAARPPVSAAR